MSDPGPRGPCAPIVSTRGVVKQYGERRVLDNVSFDVARGERVAVVGPSGSGKSTLLNCLGGIDRPDQGRIAIDGQDLASMDGDALAYLRLGTVSTVFQFFHLLPTLTAAENVEFPLQLLGLASSERRQRVARLLEEVNLASRAGALPSQLSGGEQQRVAIARALVTRPKLLLADEPTGNLDSANGTAVLELLDRLTREHQAALLLVTHSPEAVEICERCLHFRDGRVVEREA